VAVKPFVSEKFQKDVDVQILDMERKLKEVLRSYGEKKSYTPDPRPVKGSKKKGKK
jgi:hypothetical protein